MAGCGDAGRRQRLLQNGGVPTCGAGDCGHAVLHRRHRRILQRHVVHLLRPVNSASRSTTSRLATGSNTILPTRHLPAGGGTGRWLARAPRPSPSAKSSASPPQAARSSTSRRLASSTAVPLTITNGGLHERSMRSISALGGYAIGGSNVLAQCPLPTLKPASPSARTRFQAQSSNVRYNTAVGNEAALYHNSHRPAEHRRRQHCAL